MAWVLLLLALTAALTGCLGRGSKTTPVATETLPADTPDPAPLSKSIAAVPQPAEAPPDPMIWSRLIDGFSLNDTEHPRIDREVRRLQRSPKSVHALLARSEPYLYFVVEQIESAGFPGELALLPAVESGFRPYVHSPYGAAGLWQIMPATGQSLGLHRDWWIDERRSVEASTDAAIRYLKMLNTRFSGDWLLSLAAYNAGAGKVSRAMRRVPPGKPVDYWHLNLPRETDQYVPRLLALARVLRDPGSYGLTLPPIRNEPQIASVDTGGQIDLQIAAGLSGVALENLVELNADKRRWSSPPDGPHRLLLPLASISRFEQGLRDLPDDARLRWQRHEIRSGDNLIRIARKYDVTVTAIKQANHLRNSHIRAGKHLLIPLSGQPLAGNAGLAVRPRQRTRYRVRKGDSLYKIAARFDVSVTDLRRWNQVGRYIRPGQRLTVYIDPDA